MPSLTGSLLLAALAAAPAAAAPEAPSRLAAIDEARRVLDYGLWNDRINALYGLGELGRDGLETIEYSDDDADWQVRLTAVHFMGKAGPAAAPELADLALREPCPHVRLSALLWLSRMGPAAAGDYRRAASPEDEDALAHLPEGYRPELMGKPLVVDAPDGMTPEFFNGGLDLRVCASSEHAGRLHPEGAAAATGAALAARQESNDAVVTPDVPAWARGGKSTAAAKGKPESLPDPKAIAARAEPLSPAPRTPAERKRNMELDRILAPGLPETLPAPVSPGPGQTAISKAEPRYEPSAERRMTAEHVAAASARTPETMPPGKPGFATPEAARGTAEIVADAGTGRPENDPIPVLIAQLSAPDAKRRARAADELGKRGAAAAPAVLALRRALTDADRRVRASAVLALGGAGRTTKGVEADVRRSLRDRDEDVRFSAGIALERLRRR